MKDIEALPVTRFTVLTSLLAGMLLCAPAFADPVCKIIPLDSEGPSSPTGSNADAIAQKLNDLTSAVTVKAINAGTLFVCADAATEPLVEEAIKKLSATNYRPETNQLRLYFYRDAASLATVLDGALAGIGVKALGSDLLVFKMTDPGDQRRVRELKRWIALLDAPRPEVTLNAWSVQVSASKPEAVDATATAVRSVVHRYNEELQEAMGRAWSYLGPIRADEANWAPYFGHYVIDEFSYARDAPGCRTSFYCLGYQDAFSVSMQPSLMNMLGILTGIRSADWNAFVNELENGKVRAGRNAKPDPLTSRCVTAPSLCGCEDLDAQYYAAAANTAPHFACFRQQLKTSLGESVHLARLRTAMADFLFQYKHSIEYPHELSSYDYASSAQRLDVELDPLLVAFNEDLVVYLRNLQQELRDLNPKTLGYSSNGIVTIRTISGTDSSVTTQTQSAFKTTPPPLVQDFLKQLESAPSTLPGTISKYLPPNAADALIAFLNSGKSSTVTLGRDLNLTVTPSTLPGANAAELKITLESKNEAAPQTIAPDGTSANDTTDQVAVHSFNTHVRVDSLKLFEISTLSAELSRGREPIPLLPPFVALPYIGSFLKLPLKPSRAFHQSFAIISATILPTAADLLNGLRFNDDVAKVGDRQVGLYALPEEERRRVTEHIRGFHRRMLACIARSTISSIAKPAAAASAGSGEVTDACALRE